MRKHQKWSLALLAALLCSLVLCAAAFADAGDPLTVKEKNLALYVGDTRQLTIQTAEEQPVVCTSLTASVVQVDETGRITAVGEGKGSVRVALEDGSASAICNVQVTMPLPVESLREGETVQLSVPFDGAVWTSSSEAVASVDEKGLVKGASFGRAYITASNGEESRTFTVSVGGHIGIDVSKWNEPVDWTAMKEQNVEFVIIRAGYGEDSTDQNFVQNVEGAIESGIPFGIYYYSYAKDTAKAAREAAYCISLLEPYKDHLSLPVVYDIEQYKELSGKQMTDIALTFAEAMNRAGMNAMFYSYGNLYAKIDLRPLSDFGLGYWYAYYPNVPNFASIPSIRGAERKPEIWQYSSDGMVRGALASGRTDLNVLYMPEYLTFDAPKLQITATEEKAEIHWGGSSYASKYTLYRMRSGQKAKKLGEFAGNVHYYTDQEFKAGDGYYVTMEIADPIDGTVCGSYTSDAVHPEIQIAMRKLRLETMDSGTVSGGGLFPEGTTVEVRAKANEGFVFSGWYDKRWNDSSAKQLSASPAYQFTLKEDTTLYAWFAKEEPPVVPEKPTEPENPVEPQQPEKPEPPAEPEAPRFEDVKPTDWYADAVDFVVENGLFSGTAPNRFAPKDTMTRAMLVTVLYRQAGSPEASNHNRFNDVSADIWYARPVTWAYNNGIVKGTAPKLFSPEAPVTREQLLTILQRYSEKMGMELTPTTEGELSVFTDAGEISDFARDAMQWGVAGQLIQGAGQKLNPKGQATRAECAAILMRWLSSEEGE